MFKQIYRPNHKIKIYDYLDVLYIINEINPNLKDFSIEYSIFFIMDKENNFIEMLTDNTGNADYVNPKWIDSAKRIYNIEGRKIIHIHNHPNGFSIPSLNDTRTINNYKINLQEWNLDLVDYYILGQKDNSLYVKSLDKKILIDEKLKNELKNIKKYLRKNNYVLKFIKLRDKTYGSNKKKTIFNKLFSNWSLEDTLEIYSEKIIKALEERPCISLRERPLHIEFQVPKIKI